MEIKFVISDTIKDRVINALCANYNYSDIILDPKDPTHEKTIPNPETKPVFAKRMIQQFIKENVKSYEAAIAQDTARATAIDKAETDITIT